MMQRNLVIFSLVKFESTTSARPNFLSSFQNRVVDEKWVKNKSDRRQKGRSEPQDEIILEIKTSEQAICNGIMDHEKARMV